MYEVNRRGRLPRRILWVAIFLVVVLTVAVISVRTVYYQQLRPVSNSQAIKIITIPSGTASTVIGSDLQRQGLIRSSAIFQWYIRTNNVRDSLQAGTYALRPSMSVQDIVNVLVDGSVKSELLTILPGQRIDQVRQAFINSGFQPAAVDRALDPAQYSGHPALSDKPAAANLEGFLYPDSYQKNADTDPAAVVRQSLDEMAKHLTPDVRSAFASHGLSVYQGVALASVIEQEVSRQADRAQAAQVFLSRLQNNMPLGSDVTAFYGAITAGKEPSVSYDSPYNTRLHDGLPPGPISNVSQSSLLAVAHPADTSWLYFVAGDDGTTYFSRTLDEHEALTRQHCHQLCAQ